MKRSRHRARGLDNQQFWIAELSGVGCALERSLEVELLKLALYQTCGRNRRGDRESGASRLPDLELLYLLD